MRVRKVPVLRAVVTSALDPQYVHVTIPAAPWEQGEDFAALNRERQLEKDRKRLLAEHMREVAKSRKAGTTGICRVPGCGLPLYPGNKSGVCRQHAHHDLCGCPDCNRRREQ